MIGAAVDVFLPGPVVFEWHQLIEVGATINHALVIDRDTGGVLRDGARRFEATAFHRGARAAMERAGFVIGRADGSNPRYRATYADGGPVTECFSKTHDDPANPTKGFAAIMTCSEADQACPAVPGAELRVSLPYDEPKKADGTPDEEAAYDARCLQIATEMLYLFSRVS